MTTTARTWAAGSDLSRGSVACGWTQPRSVSSWGPPTQLKEMKMTIKPNDVAFYHFPCADGFTAAWAANEAAPGVRNVPLDHSAFDNLVPPANAEVDVGDLYF